MEMRTPVVALAALLLAAASAAAQPPHGFPISDRIAIGASLGRLKLDRFDSLGESFRGVDVALKTDLPITVSDRLRVEIGHIRFRASGYESRTGSFGLARASIAWLRTLDPPGKSSPARLYAGGGVGLYRYNSAFAREAPHTRAGLHGVAGFEYILPGRRSAITSDAQFHGFDGPGELRTMNLMVKISAGFAWRF